MEVKLQNILFPDKDRYKNNDKLFFKSVQTVYDDDRCNSEEHETADCEYLLQYLLLGQIEEDHNAADYTANDNPDPVGI